MVTASMPAPASSRRLSSLMVTWRQAGSSGGGGRWARWGRCQGRSWWWRTVGRPRPGAGHDGRRRRVEGQRAEVLDHHQVGAGQCRGDLGRLGGARAAPMARPGQQVVDRPLAGHRGDVEARARRAPSATWPPRPTPRRRRPGGTRRGRPSASGALYGHPSSGPVRDRRPDRCGTVAAVGGRRVRADRATAHRTGRHHSESRELDPWPSER